MARWLYRLGTAAFHRRWWVVSVWVLLVVAVVSLGSAFGGTLTSQITIPGIESQRASDLLGAQFPAANGGTLRAVFAAPNGGNLNDQAAQTAIKNSLTAAGNVNGVINVSSLTVSPQGAVAFADVLFAQPPEQVPNSEKNAVQSAMQPARAAGLEVEYGGSAETTSSAVGGPGEIIGVVVAAIVLFITLRVLIAAGLPILTAIVGVAIGLLGVQFLARFVTLPNTTTALATMIGLAVGIDYALFIVSRHREQLSDPNMSVSESIGRAIGTAGSAVVFAGLTVVIALSALSAARIPFLTAMGLAAAGTVAIAVIVALTLVPALLGFMGERVRPRGNQPVESATAAKPSSHPSVWGRWGHLIRRAPSIVLVVGAALLLAMSIPVLHMRLGLPSNETEPTGSTLHKSYELLTQGFGPGFNAAIIFVVDARDIPTDQRNAVATHVANMIRQDSDVATATPPTFNQAQSVAIVSVVPKTGPDDDATTNLVQRLRAAPEHLVTQAGGVAYVTGMTAAAIDISAKLSAALPLFIGIIVVLAMLLLLIAFRSIVVPVKAVAGFLLSIGASMGLTVLVFQDGHLIGLFQVAAAAPIVSFIPILLIGILFGLAMDYEVFLVSRMREHFHHFNDSEEAVVGGLSQSGRVVCAAALIMSSVFAGFLFTQDPIIKSIAFALTVGVLIDAFVVRMTLVPAVMLLVGRVAWRLPSWLHRALPHVDIEGASLSRRTPERVAVSSEVSD